MAETKPTDSGAKSVAVDLGSTIRKRLKVYAARHELKIKDVVAAALDEYLKNRKA